MVANRLLQLWHESRRFEPGPDLIALMQALAPASNAREPISLGSLVQQYRILRGQGMGHDAAIATAMEEGR